MPAEARGLFEMKEAPPKPRVIGCKACEDFGTIVICTCKPPDGMPCTCLRTPGTMAELVQREMPCLCALGQVWRQAFEEHEYHEQWLKSPAATSKAPTEKRFSVAEKLWKG